MKFLSSFFKKAVNRPIEGVIKADDIEDLKLKTEVEEYVLTDEVEQRLEAFFEAYNRYEGVNGVWISGFFGSGKSHLLKMLALLLENKVIDGQSVADLFVQKCSDDNEILKGAMKTAVRIPSKSILFNIDQKADVISKTETDALVSVFVKVFDEACGYYGKQAYIAQFERELDRDGLFVPFKNKFKKASGQTWEFGRERANRYSKEIDKAYNTVTGQNSENILDKHRTDYHLSIEDFANHVKEYIDKQVPNFRLNFFVDEVGQYIANNEKLMVNLQTVAESLATKCKGQAWVIVTAQNDMSKVLGEMENRLNSNDYTKIQDRFKIRMNLTSAAVAEVIQKRLLAKNTDAERELAVLYKKEVDNFKTLFDFAEGSRSYKNFQSEKHFVDCYPFIPYQFPLFQSAIENLSSHDAFQGKYSSVGERSMLGVFQHVAINVSENSEIGELATFDKMFEGVRNSLKTGIQSSILKAEDNLENPFAVRVLKVLFLVKYIKEFKSTIRNLCVLMYHNFDENLADLTKKVEEALNILEQQTYIQRNGEVYEYLTDEEKDVEKEIKNTDIDRDDVVSELSKLFFDNIIRNPKIRYGEDGRDYPFSRKLDDKLCGREYELAINVITPFNDNHDAFNESNINMASVQRERELLVCLSQDFRLVEDLKLYKKTYKYINENMNNSQQESVKRILTDKLTQNQERYNQIKAKVEEVASTARFYIKGSEIEVGGEHAQTRIIKAFQELVGRTYINLKMLCGHAYKEEEVNSILNNAQKGLFTSDNAVLSEAEQEILGYIQRNVSFRTTVKTVLDAFEKIPYGWSYAAILCNIAKLCARRKIEVKEDSNILDDNEVAVAIRSTAKQANLILQPQADFSPSQIRNLKDFYGEFANEPASESDAKSLALAVADLLKNQANEIEKLSYQESQYPFLKVLKPVLETFKNCLSKPYAWYLTDFRDLHDEILTAKESIVTPVANFMNGIGREIYEEATRFMQSQEANFQYIDSIKINDVRNILQDENCFRGNTIQALKSELNVVEELVNAKIGKEKIDAIHKLEELKTKLTSISEFASLSDDKKQRLDEDFNVAFDRINGEKLIAVIRDNVARFEENQYSHWLSVITTPQVQDVTVVDETTPDAPVEPVKQVEFVPARNIKAKYSKPILTTEAEVEEYIASLKEAMIQQISDGKRIQL